MVLGIGTDIIEVERIEKAISNFSFVRKVFTSWEVCEGEIVRRARHFAGLFAAKEAVAKALGTGFRGFLLTDIEILQNDFGAPYVVLFGYAKELAQEKGVTNIYCSISHCKQYATACVVLEGGN